MVPPSPSLIPEREKEHKILELTTMMVHQLTDRRGSYKVSGCHCLFLHGGVGVFRRTQGSLYKDVMMDNQPPLTSPGWIQSWEPPERCPRPLYSRDSTQEDHIIPPH
ncbi:unnamed protein product, partial [Staurois parvus]